MLGVDLSFYPTLVLKRTNRLYVDRTDTHSTITISVLVNTLLRQYSQSPPSCFISKEYLVKSGQTVNDVWPNVCQPAPCKCLELKGNF